VNPRDLRALCRECHEAVHVVLKLYPHLYNAKNPHSRWLRVSKKTSRWKRYVKRFGKDCAAAAMILIDPYLKWSKKMVKVRIAAKQKRREDHIKHVLFWLSCPASWGHFHRVISKIEND
jgi:hypothetical protein